MQLIVNLDAYSGPLDLLLDLISKQKVDIYDIEISKITKHYLEVIENSIHSEDTDISAFLLMSSTLVEIKSRSLIPKNTDEDDDEVRQFNFSSPEEFRSYLRGKLAKAVNARSDANDIISRTNHILTLFTCNYTDQYGRAVLLCVPKNEAQPTTK